MPAVAEKRAQLVARDNQSRFSRRNVSTVVPACISALHNTVALWHTLFRDSTAVRMRFSSSRSDLLCENRNSKCRDTGSSPDKTDRSNARGDVESSDLLFSPSVFVSVASAAAASAPSVFVSGSVVFSAGGKLSATRSRNAWISFSCRENAIWYASSRASSSPSTSDLRIAATPSASSRNIRHWHTFRWSISAEDVSYIFTSARRVSARNAREVTSVWHAFVAYARLSAGSGDRITASSSLSSRRVSSATPTAWRNCESAKHRSNMRSTTSIRRGSIGSVLSSEALRRSMYSSIALVSMVCTKSVVSLTSKSEPAHSA
mmetsp:Transcript_14462/g.60931  ORF Transcript_14462/g.60931 Transcript_14462/m.60931 type:complete len:318 (+) Transcript_14462:1718-2671(+)